MAYTLNTLELNDSQLLPAHIKYPLTHFFFNNYTEECSSASLSYYFNLFNGEDHTGIVAF